jgi:hypothetical protein
MRKWMRLAVMVAALASSVHAGGWAVVTVRDLPEYAVAGKPLKLVFVVRGAGISPTGGIGPRVAAKSGTRTVDVPARETKKEGEYEATLVLPTSGKWTIRIDAFGDGRPSRWDGSTLPEFVVIAPGSPAPPLYSLQARGERLFVTTGCTVCHISGEERVALARELPGVLRDPKLDLDGRRFPEAYLNSVLTRPDVPLAADAEHAVWDMPNLELSKSEIAVLTAFINGEKLR